MEAKKFLINVGLSNGVLRGVIEEQNKRFSLWIGSASLRVCFRGFREKFSGIEGGTMELDMEGRGKDVFNGKGS